MRYSLLTLEFIVPKMQMLQEEQSPELLRDHPCHASHTSISTRVQHAMDKHSVSKNPAVRAAPRPRMLRYSRVIPAPLAAIIRASFTDLTRQ